jgi:hypothetical protein
MKTANKLPVYASKQIDEIVSRIIALRASWLRHVKSELASHKNRPVRDHSELSAEPAE